MLRTTVKRQGATVRSRWEQPGAFRIEAGARQTGSGFSGRQIDLLMKCSAGHDMAEWNEWRNHNPAETVLLQGVNIARAWLRGRIFAAQTSAAQTFAPPISAARNSTASIVFGPISTAPTSATPIYAAPIFGGPISAGQISVEPIFITPISAGQILAAPTSATPIFGLFSSGPT